MPTSLSGILTLPVLFRRILIIMLLISISSKEWKVTTRACFWSTNILIACTVTGVAVVTISRGVVVWSDGKLLTKQGSGRYVPRPCFGQIFDAVAARDRARNELLQKVEREPYTGPVFKPWVTSCAKVQIITIVNLKSKISPSAIFLCKIKISPSFWISDGQVYQQVNLNHFIPFLEVPSNHRDRPLGRDCKTEVPTP